MAVRKKKTVEVKKDKNIVDVGLVSYSKDAMRRYGEEVIENRALPDFRDGLKPVQRRILWSMFKLGNTATSPHSKSARTVGDVIGKYHPHGDTAAYGAMVTMANLPTPMVDGKGNWGGLLDNAASMRYTNARLSKYSQATFFDANFTKIINLIDNYDGKDKEPLIIPALLPNVIINGASGIGVGTTACLPSYTPESVAIVVKKALSGEMVDYKTCIKHLKFKQQYGATLDEANSDLKNFYKTGKGAVNFKPAYEILPDKRLLIIKGVPDGLNVLTKLDRVKQLKSVQDWEEKSSIEDGYRWHIYIAKSVPLKDIKAEAEKICKMFEQRNNYVVNVTERYVTKDGEPRANFRSTNVPQLIMDWVKWRVEIEVQSLNYQIKQTEEVIRQLKLKILAASSLDVVFQALKQKKDADKYLSTKLKISMDDANFILEMKVRQLSALDADIQRKKLKEVEAHQKSLQGHLKKPNDKILADMPSLLKAI